MFDPSHTDWGEFGLWYVVFLFSLTCHEGAHALLAYLGGDETAYHGGQVSLNPLPHIRQEPFGTLVLPLVSFLWAGWVMGWASTPYDPHWAQRHRRRAALMSLAGPAANFLLAFAAFVAARLLLAADVFVAPTSAGFAQIVTAADPGSIGSPLAAVVSMTLVLNVLLGCFNLIPVPPLDGSGALESLLPERAAARYGEWIGGFRFLGLLLAWSLFSFAAQPLFGAILWAVHPGVAVRTMSADATRLLDLDEIRRAAHEVAGRVHRTPLIRSRTFSEMTGHRVFLKCENLQKTGSFKPRGAVNRIARLTPAERRRGVLAASAGNHAQGLAYAAAALGVPVTVVMPENAQPVKIEATRAGGAEVLLHGRIFHEALARSLELQAERSMTFVHPCSDPLVVAGAGTVGLEIVEDLPDLDAVVVPVGGGGLLSGTAVAVRALRPGARVFGVEPRSAPAMERAMAAGRVVTLDSAISIADGMAGLSVFDYTLAHARALCAGVLLVEEESMLEAMRLLLTRAKLLTEPAGAAPLAAILDGLPDLAPGSNVVALLSGGNQDLGRLAGWLRDGVPRTLG